MLVSLKKKIVIVTCVNNFLLFENLKASLCLERDIQLFPINNTQKKFSVPSAYNFALKNINAEIFVFVHQDVSFPKKWLDCLIKQIQQLEDLDQYWGVLGVMGIKKNGLFAGHIIDPHTNRPFGKLPCRVQSLDEVCLVIRRSSDLFFDEILGNYHFYGADICLQAQKNNLNCYAIDAPLAHLSGGKANHDFWFMAEKLKEKWSQIKGAQNSIETTCGVFRLNDKIYSNIEYYYKVLRRKVLRRLQNRHKN
jgi:hypothetical protein